MSIHSFNVAVGDQVYVGSNLEEVGAVRQVAKDHLIVYIENAGEFRIDGPTVVSAKNGKLILDPDKLEPKLAEAVEKAHAAEE